MGGPSGDWQADSAESAGWPRLSLGSTREKNEKRGVTSGRWQIQGLTALVLTERSYRQSCSEKDFWRSASLRTRETTRIPVALIVGTGPGESSPVVPP
jgi:hypothetical protein